MDGEQSVSQSSGSSRTMYIVSLVVVRAGGCDDVARNRSNSHGTGTAPSLGLMIGWAKSNAMQTASNIGLVRHSDLHDLNLYRLYRFPFSSSLFWIRSMALEAAGQDCGEIIMLDKAIRRKLYYIL